MLPNSDDGWRTAVYHADCITILGNDLRKHLGWYPRVYVCLVTFPRALPVLAYNAAERSGAEGAGIVAYARMYRLKIHMLDYTER